MVEFFRTFLIIFGIIGFISNVISLLLENSKKKDSLTKKMMVSYTISIITMITVVAIAKKIIPEPMNLFLIIICMISIIINLNFRRKATRKRYNNPPK